MQVVARHAYALTFEKEHVMEWERELSKGMWGGQGSEEELLLREILHTRLVGQRPALTIRPMTSFAWVFGKELMEIVDIPAT